MGKRNRAAMPGTLIKPRDTKKLFRTKSEDARAPVRGFLASEFFQGKGGGEAATPGDSVACGTSAFVSCPGTHGCEEFVAWRAFGCDSCGARVEQDVALYGCRVCDYDLCVCCATDAASAPSVVFSSDDDGGMVAEPEPFAYGGASLVDVKGRLMDVKGNRLSKAPGNYDDVLAAVRHAETSAQPLLSGFKWYFTR